MVMAIVDAIMMVMMAKIATKLNLSRVIEPTFCLFRGDNMDLVGGNECIVVDGGNWVLGILSILVDMGLFL